MITQAINLNLIPGQVLPRVNVSQYDSGTRTLQMTLFNGEQIFNVPSGASGFIQGTKPDRTGFQYAATVTAGSNIVTIDITEQMTAVKGEVVCELVLANDDDRIATVNFIIYVEPAALADDIIISETELPLIEEAAELAQRIDAIATQIDADADRAEAAVEHYPYIGANGNWYVFDLQTEQFVDTTIAATGPQGPTGPTGPTGPQGPTGPTGNGIVSITKTGTSGLVDTYTITFTDGTTTTFTVTNGQDGQGSGDMTKAVYDSTNAVADAGGIVAYVAAHSGAGTLAGLDDVTLSSLAAGDTLVYNATTQKWENSTVIQTLTNEVKDMNNVLGAKNILLNTATTQTKNGITFTVNDDGSVTCNGTASENAVIYISQHPTLAEGNYILSGCPSGGASSTYEIIARRSDSTNIRDNGDGAEFTLSSSFTISWIQIVIRSGTTVSDLTFYPMIRLASIEDDTYEPYAKTNQQLTEDVEENSTQIQTLTTQINKAYKSDDSSETTIDGADYIPFYDSSASAMKKILVSNAKFGGGALYYSGRACSATTGNFCTVSSADITANHVVAECTFSKPSAITTDVTWTTSSGSLVLNGTCGDATCTANIVLVEKSN